MTTEIMIRAYPPAVAPGAVVGDVVVGAVVWPVVAG
jgi:hypothetical protein